jgi:predicted nucleotidyltransferase
MARHIKDPKEIFTEIISDYKGLFGDDLVSIILYGSATGKDYRPGESDINFMIVLTEAGIERMDRAFDTVKKWRKRNVAMPLFLTETYVETSLDVFPIEYLNFQRNHIRVHGKDILSNLSFNPEFIRLQCEREIKGKLLLLREAYLETADKGKSLKKVIGQSLGAFVAIFEALLYLKDLELPKEKLGIIRATAGAFELDADVFERLLEVKAEKIKPNDDEMKKLFRHYLTEVRKLSKLVDALGG